MSDWSWSTGLWCDQSDWIRPRVGHGCNSQHGYCTYRVQVHGYLNMGNCGPVTHAPEYPTRDPQGLG